MLAGTGAAIALDSTERATRTRTPAGHYSAALGQPEAAAWTDRGISVVRLGEGFWRNGGWLLEGGLLALASIGPSTIELYGKAVIRRLPYIPFPFHRSIPHETGYEFFLLHRPGPVAAATILRRWTFGPGDVQVERRPAGASWEEVRGALSYDPDTHAALIEITGLTHPFLERLALPPEVGERGR